MKILGSDYDGTFNHGGIGEDKISAIQTWRNTGNKFGIISGRGPDFYAYLLKKAPALKYDFLATCNGGYIMDQNGKLIYEARCDNVSIPELISDLFAWGCTFAHVNSKKYICVVEKFEDHPTLVAEEDVCLLQSNPKVDYFNQISVQLPSVGEASMIVEKIRRKYIKSVNPLQNGICIDIVPANVNKAQGLYRVMEFFGGSYENVIAIGDNINDIDMLKEFRSYAMKNGVDEIRNIADGIVGDVTEVLLKELSF